MASSVPPNLHYILFFIALNLILFGSSLYMCLRIRRLYGWVLFSLIFLLQVASPPLYRSVRTIDDFNSSQPIIWLSFLTLGFLAMSVFCFLFLEIPKLWIRKNKKIDLSRRKFLKSKLNFLGLGTAGLFTGIGFIQAKKLPELSRIDIPITGLHPDLDGFKIVQLTDTHIGPTIRADFLEKVVTIANETNADVVALTGDLLDGYPTHLLDQLSAFSKLRSKFGTFYVTGNHEFYWGIKEWLPEIEKLGATVLKNESVIIQKGAGLLQLSGVWDYNGHHFGQQYRSDPMKAVKTFTSNSENVFTNSSSTVSAKILLAHQPKSCIEASRAGFDLQISGHTHAGQFIPWNFFVHLAQPFTRGLNKKDKMWIYVSRGTGYWGAPLRLGIPSEIALLTLKSA